jgi:hypothetical protein
MAVTGYQPLYNNAYAITVDRNSIERNVSRILRRLPKKRALMLALNGAAAGGTATGTQKRVAHSTTELGGVRAVETQTYVNRATVSADETAIDGLIYTDSRIATPTARPSYWNNL